MKDVFNKENFNKSLSRKPSKWKLRYEARKENRDWIEKSAITALNILTLLKEKKWSQKRLAEELGVTAQQVSKIVKGQVNFTYDSITKLENALDYKLLEIPLIDRERDELTLSTFLNWTDSKISLPTFNIDTNNIFHTQSVNIESFTKSKNRVPKKIYTKMNVIEKNILKPTG